MNPTMPKKPGNRKKPPVIFVAIGGAVIFLAVSFISFAILSSVSKEDYAKALTQYDEVEKATESFDTQVGEVVTVTKYGSDDEYNAEIAKLDQLKTQLEDQNETLNAMKAVRFGEGRDFYGPYKDTMNDYLAFSTELIDSVKQGRQMFAACAKISTALTVSEQTSTLNTCVAALETVDILPEENIAVWVATLKDKYKAYQVVVSDINKLTDPFGTQNDEYKVLVAKKYAIETEISEANTAYAAAINARTSEVNVKATAEALEAFLSNQKQ